MSNIRFDYGLKPLVKHGSHDQKTHGSWATGISLDPAVASSILDRVRVNGGLSVNMVDGSEPTTGFMVAKGKQYGRIVKAEDFYDSERGPEILYQYMKANKSDLATGKNYLGLWHNTADNQVYLDVSENIQDRERATSAGRERDQISIWDVANFAEIDTGGTGSVGKQRYQGGGVESEYLGYDGRRITGLRKSSLGEDGKTQVIRFEYGLKPIFKHEGGPEHDQKSHGNWATGQGYTESQAEGITRYENLGPSVEMLDEAISGIAPTSYEDLREFVLNDGEQYDEMSISQGLDERVREATELAEARLGRPLTDQEKANIYEAEQEYAVKNYILQSGDDIRNIRNEQMGLIGNASDLEAPFNDVFFSSVNVVEEDGNEYEMYSQVTDVSLVEDEGIYVEGQIYADGMAVGTFERVFFKEGDTWNVEHKWFEINDEFQGKGFGKDFLQQSEDYYTAKGFGYIKLMAGLSDGARHWARAGFDWDPDSVRSSADKLKTARNYSLTDEEKPAFDALFERMYDSNAEAGRRVRDMRSPDFPMPAEFANLGWENRVKDDEGEWDWAGKRLMSNMVIDYVKPLTAEGRNLLSGPIDRDGDGLIYDGTGRERPAPKNN